MDQSEPDETLPDEKLPGQLEEENPSEPPEKDDPFDQDFP